MKPRTRRPAFGWAEIAVLAASAASFGLLCWRLDDRSLWLDEYLSLLTSHGTWTQTILQAASDIHPPLYFLMLHAWIGLMGISDFALRWPSAAWAIPAIPLLAVTGRRLFGGTIGTLAAVGLALSPALIEFGRMARYYSLVTTIGLLSTLLLLRALSRPTWGRWAAYAVSGTALLYTFYPTAGLLAAHAGLVMLWPNGRRLIGRWILAEAAVGLVFLPMLITAAAQRVASVASATGADLSRSALGFGLGLAASGYTFGIGETVFPWNPAAWAGLLVVAGLLVAAARPTVDRNFWLCAGFATVCTVFMSATTTFVSVSTPFLNVPVRGLFVLPFFLLCLAAGLARVGSRWGRLALAGALLVVWAISLSNDYRGDQFLNPIYLTPAKEAAARVSQQAEPTDLVISDYDSLVNVYLPATLPTGEAGPPRLTTQDDAAVVAGLAQQPTRVWLVTLGRDATEAGSNAGSVRQRLAASYVLERSEGLLQIDPTYRRLKDLVLHRISYEYRLTIELYYRRSP